MTPDRPPILGAATQAWRDTARTINALPAITLIAFLIFAGLTIAQQVVPTAVAKGGASMPFVAAFLLSFAQALLLAPYFIAVHRFIILGEVTARYDLTSKEPRLKWFFSYSVALLVVGAIPSLIAGMLTPASGVQLTVVALGALAVAIISIRVILLFPSVAVDAPGATLENAMADTKGYAWRIFFICFVAALPLVVVIVLLAMISVSTGTLPDSRKTLSLSTIVRGVVDGAFVFLLATIAIVVASRLYERLGRRTKGAP